MAERDEVNLKLSFSGAIAACEGFCSQTSNINSTVEF